MPDHLPSAGPVGDLPEQISEDECKRNGHYPTLWIKGSSWVALYGKCDCGRFRWQPMDMKYQGSSDD